MLQKTPGPEYRGGRQCDYANEKGGSEKAPFRRKKYKAAGGAQANSAQRLSITPGPVSGFRFQVSGWGASSKRLRSSPGMHYLSFPRPGVGSKNLKPETWT
jgi:hypothetical protein